MDPSRATRLKIAALLLIGITPAEFNWAYNPVLAHTPWAFWCVDVSRFVVLPAILCAWGIHRGWFTFADLGLHRKIHGRSSDALFAVAMIVTPALICALDPYLVHFANRFYVPRPEGDYFSYVKVLPPPGPQTGLIRFLAVVYMSVSAGITEEFYFRGLARRVFGRGIVQAGLFAIISSLLFASIHAYGGQAKAIDTFCYGLVFATLYLVTGNLWPLIVGHMLVDFGWLSGG